MRRAYAEYRSIAAAGARRHGSSRSAHPRNAQRPPKGGSGSSSINLERLRWLPRQMPRDRVVVNAAIARLQLFRDGRPVFTTRVVVGEIDKQTPEFRSVIDSVLFNPPVEYPTLDRAEGNFAEIGR